MSKFFLLTIITLFAAFAAFGGQTFIIKDASKIYDIKITVDKCSDEVCNEKGTVYLMKKNQTQVFQTFEMEEMYLHLDSSVALDKNIVEVKRDKIWGIALFDYNFDGIADLSIGNGYYRPYGGTSYDVFLFDKAKNKFVKHKGLTEIETENVSVDVNKKQKYIEAMTKSGCCWHQITRYRMNGTRLVKFYVYTEEWADSDNAEITTERLVDKRWIKKTVKKRMG